jgi:hypothetical protein
LLDRVIKKKYLSTLAVKVALFDHLVALYSDARLFPAVLQHLRNADDDSFRTADIHKVTEGWELKILLQQLQE